MYAQRYRHRITLQTQATVQDPNTGFITKTWSDWLTAEPAHVEPLSSREYLAAQAGQFAAEVRVVIRWRAGITSSMRIIHDGTIYNIGSVLADNKTGREWITLLASSANPGN
jgi:SPP1 family predicted phage head-tail adaptor